MFLYYLPGKEKLSRSELKASPIGPVIWDVTKTEILFQTRVVQVAVRQNGPDGSSGQLIIVTPPSGIPEPFRIGYYRDEQTWIEAKGCWIGYFNEHLPTPEDLSREFLVSGEEHILGDGNVWICPIIRRRGIMALPSSWGVDPKTGDFRAKILPEYDSAWEVARIAWDVIAGRETLKLSQALKLCVDAVGINYRIGPVESSLLQLFDNTNFEKVLGAAIDQQFLQEVLGSEAQKKT